MRLKEQRKFYKKSNKVMRRARRLYVRLCLENMEKYGNPIIDLMAKRMHESGLYWEGADSRSVRQSINGHHFQLTKVREDCYRDTFAWHTWNRKMDKEPWTGYYAHKKRVSIFQIKNPPESEETEGLGK